MFCSKCGNENNKESKYCAVCGASLLENQPIEQHQTNKKLENTRLSNTPLSFISLGCLIMQVIVLSFIKNIGILSFLTNIPWILISLVLAIISKCKNNDKLSGIMMIIDIIGIILFIIWMIIGLLFFSFVFGELLDEFIGCVQTWG